MDFNYLTSRLGVMSFPAEGLESTYRNHIDDVKIFLENRHGPDNYAVYNLCQRTYKGQKFNNRVRKKLNFLDGFRRCCFKFFA